MAYTPDPNYRSPLGASANTLQGQDMVGVVSRDSGRRELEASSQVAQDILQAKLVGERKVLANAERIEIQTNASRAIASLEKQNEYDVDTFRNRANKEREKYTNTVAKALQPQVSEYINNQILAGEQNIGARVLQRQKWKAAETNMSYGEELAGRGRNISGDLSSTDTDIDNNRQEYFQLLDTMLVAGALTPSKVSSLKVKYGQDIINAGETAKMFSRDSENPRKAYIEFYEDKGTDYTLEQKRLAQEYMLDKVKDHESGYRQAMATVNARIGEYGRRLLVGDIPNDIEQFIDRVSTYADPVMVNDLQELYYMSGRITGIMKRGNSGVMDRLEELDEKARLGGLSSIDTRERQSLQKRWKALQVRSKDNLEQVGREVGIITETPEDFETLPVTSQQSRLSRVAQELGVKVTLTNPTQRNTIKNMLMGVGVGTDTRIGYFGEQLDKYGNSYPMMVVEALGDKGYGLATLGYLRDMGTISENKVADYFQNQEALVEDKTIRKTVDSEDTRDVIEAELDTLSIHDPTLRRGVVEYIRNNLADRNFFDDTDIKHLDDRVRYLSQEAVGGNGEWEGQYFSKGGIVDVNGYEVIVPTDVNPMDFQDNMSRGWFFDTYYKTEDIIVGNNKADSKYWLDNGMEVNGLDSIWDDIHFRQVGQGIYELMYDGMNILAKNGDMGTKVSVNYHKSANSNKPTDRRNIFQKNRPILTREKE